MTKKEQDAWDFMNEIEDRQRQAATGITNNSELSGDQGIEAIDTAYGVLDQLGRQCHFMMMARVNQYV